MTQFFLLIFIVLFAVSYGRRHDDMASWGSLTDCNGNTYAAIKAKFLRDGYAVFRSCTFKNGTIDQAALFTKTFPGGRSQDAWKTEDSVLDIATDDDTLAILSYVNSHAVFPFQTLNFPIATQQPIHSDVVHFDTLPERGLMTAAWVALEDIHPDAGPLIYYPGSHNMGLWDMDEIGSRMDYDHLNYVKTEQIVPHYQQYERELQLAIDKLGLKSETATIKKGESFLWAASLLHGGSKLNDPNRTRVSQVTHYFMAGAKRFWAPKISIPSIGHIVYKCNIPSCMVTKSKITNCVGRRLERFKNRIYTDFSAAAEYGVHCT